tara:strand:- start:19654 stop:20316 length:663 start_codon:yes stop_codon:yes gene_type:complete
MEDALSRLEAAIKLTMVQHVLASPEALGRVRLALGQMFSQEGRETETPEQFSALLSVGTEEEGEARLEAYHNLFPATETREGRTVVHRLWTLPTFIAPPIAALAVFLDRMLTDRTDSLLTLGVSADEDALSGYTLRSLTMSAYQADGSLTWKERTLRANDRRRASVMLSAASLYFLLDPRWMRFAPIYLHAEATRTAPKEAWTDDTGARSGRSSFVEIYE